MAFDGKTSEPEAALHLLPDFGDATRPPLAAPLEGYYSVVNGYKEPFIDEDATSLEGGDRYAE